MTSQKQKSGDNSTNLQIGTVINAGIDYEQARKISNDVFTANFLKLADQAAQIATERANKFTIALLEKIRSLNPQLLNHFKDPGILHSLYCAQKEYACIGDDDLLDLLSNILVDRIQEDKKTFRQIVLNESLTIAPKLTNGQICTLSFIFLLNHAGFCAVKNINSFLE